MSKDITIKSEDLPEVIVDKNDVAIAKQGDVILFVSPERGDAMFDLFQKEIAFTAPIEDVKSMVIAGLAALREIGEIK